MPSLFFLRHNATSLNPCFLFAPTQRDENLPIPFGTSRPFEMRLHRLWCVMPWLERDEPGGERIRGRNSSVGSKIYLIKGCVVCYADEIRLRLGGKFMRWRESRLLLRVGGMNGLNGLDDERLFHRCLKRCVVSYVSVSEG